MPTTYVSLQRFYGALADCQIVNIEIQWCPDFFDFVHAEILHRSYGAPTMSIYRDFAEIIWCPDYVNLQRFYGAPNMSIYRDFAEISWCPDYVNLQRFCRDFMVPRLCQFTEILWCPDYVNLQRFYCAPQCQFTEILHDKTNPLKYL